MEFVLVWGAAQAHPWVQEGQTLILSVHCLLCTPPCKANSFFLPALSVSFVRARRGKTGEMLVICA